MVHISVAAGAPTETSVEDESNSYTSSRAYCYACTDVVYCYANTCTRSGSHGKRKNPQVNGNTRPGFSVLRFLFHCIALCEGYNRPQGRVKVC
jgi:hypothetical protein